MINTETTGKLAISVAPFGRDSHILLGWFASKIKSLSIKTFPISSTIPPFVLASALFS